MVYWSAFLANMGNYRGFGDQKFIPALEKNKLNELVVNTTAFKSEKDLVSIWDNIKDKMFSLEKNELALGFAPEVCKIYDLIRFIRSYISKVPKLICSRRERPLTSRRTAPNRTRNL